MSAEPRRAWPSGAAALAVWALAMVLALLVTLRTPVVADLTAFLPAAPTPEQQVLVEQLRSGSGVRLLLLGLRGADEAARTRASARLAEALRASGEFESVQNGDTSAQADTGQRVFARRYLLSPAVEARRFEVEGLREAIDESVSLLGTPAGRLIKPLIWRDPSGEGIRLAQAATPTGAPRLQDGVWVSRSTDRALLVLTPRADGADLDGLTRASDRVRSEFETIAATTPGLRLELAGPAWLSVSSRDQIEHEVERLALWGGVALLAVLLLSLGSPRALLLAMLPVASGVLAGIAVVGLVHGRIHGMTLGFGTTLIGESVDYALYFLLQARAAQPGETAAAGWLRQHWPTVRLGLATSLIGFAALAVSGFGGLAQLGLFSMAGLVAAGATTRWLLPRLAHQGLAGFAASAWRERSHGLLMRTATALVSGTRLARHAATALVVAAAGVLWLHPLAGQGKLSALSPVSTAALELDAELRADLGAADSGVLVAVQAADEAQALERAEAASALLDTWVQDGRLGGYQSPSLWLPSEATQRARQAVLPPPELLKQRLAAATADGPLPAARLQGFLADVETQRTGPLVTRADYAGSGIGTALQSQLLPGREGRPWTALLSLNAAPGAEIDAPKLREALRELPGTRVVQISAELDALYRHYLVEAGWQAAVGALAVALLLGATLRSASRWARVMLPLAASVTGVLALLALRGEAIGVLHLVGLLLVVAVGSNYALFFDHVREQGRADADVWASMLLASLTTVISFGLLATASVPVLATLGRVVAPGVALALLLSAAWIGAPAARADRPGMGK